MHTNPNTQHKGAVLVGSYDDCLAKRRWRDTHLVLSTAEVVEGLAKEGTPHTLAVAMLDLKDR